MSNRIYDASQLTKRKAEKAIAGSFVTRISSPNNQTSYAPLPGIYDGSIINAVNSGHMTEYTRYPTCIGISPGCPCPSPYMPIIPGIVSRVTFTIGSIIISWNAPTTGTGPFTYKITPYFEGSALEPVYTTDTTYRFENLEEMKPYSFTVCAMNSVGSGPTITSETILAPPAGLSTIMSGSSISVPPEPSLKFILNTGLDSMLNYIASVNLGPTRGSRYIYVWITSVVGAWNWVRSESRISGEHDNWNWTTNKASNPLNDNDSLIWLCSVIDYIMPFFIPSGYVSPYNCPADVVARVKATGQWNNWQNNWQTWYNYRQNDGFTTATTTQPTDSANWNQTIVVDDTTVNNISGFPQPQQWTRLTVQEKKQGYLTYSWDNVLSSCLTEGDEQTIQNTPGLVPATGAIRDAEIDEVKDITANLTDEQKIIAEFWAGGPGTVSPPLMFIWMWKEYMRILPTISCPNMIFSLQDLAIHLFEGARVTWRLKAVYMEDRPIQEIRRRFTGQQIASWNGIVDGAQWIPYQEANFITPPFADFPSGHSHFSKAFALTMNKWFGLNIIKSTIAYDQQKLICPLFVQSQVTQYGDFTIPTKSSLIQSSVPNVPITLSFRTWDEMSDSAGISRLYGGIHAETANEKSKETAVQVNSYINSTWNIQTN